MNVLQLNLALDAMKRVEDVIKVEVFPSPAGAGRGRGATSSLAARQPPPARGEEECALDDRRFTRRTALTRRAVADRAAGCARSAEDLPRRRAGVGKTYEMLSAARARFQEGVDVVVGVVETHGRRETEALLDGLEIMPRREVEYRGRSSGGDGPRRAAGAPPAAGAGR